MGGDSGGHRLHAFRSLAGNRALLRILSGYALFILTEYAVWIAMIVFAAPLGGLVADRSGASPDPLAASTDGSACAVVSASLDSNCST